MKSVYVEISIFDSEKKESPFIPIFKHYFWIEDSGVKKIGKVDINRCIKAFFKTAPFFKRKLVKENAWAIASIGDENGGYGFIFEIKAIACNEETKEIIESFKQEIPFKINSIIPSEFGTADSMLNVSIPEVKINELIKKCMTKENQFSDSDENSNFDEKLDGVKPFMVHLPLELHNRLKKYSEVSGVSMKELICMWIDTYCVEQK